MDNKTPERLKLEQLVRESLNELDEGILDRIMAKTRGNQSSLSQMGKNMGAIYKAITTGQMSNLKDPRVVKAATMGISRVKQYQKEFVKILNDMSSDMKMIFGENFERAPQDLGALIKNIDEQSGQFLGTITGLGNSIEKFIKDEVPAADTRQQAKDLNKEPQIDEPELPNEPSLGDAPKAKQNGFATSKDQPGGDMSQALPPDYDPFSSNKPKEKPSLGRSPVPPKDKTKPSLGRTPMAKKPAEPNIPIEDPVEYEPPQDTSQAPLSPDFQPDISEPIPDVPKSQQGDKVQGKKLPPQEKPKVKAPKAPKQPKVSEPKPEPKVEPAAKEPEVPSELPPEEPPEVRKQNARQQAADLRKQYFFGGDDTPKEAPKRKRGRPKKVVAPATPEGDLEDKLRQSVEKGKKK